MKYTVTRVNFDKLVKKLARLFKKLTENGQAFKFQIIEEGVKSVPVYDVDPINNVKYDTHNDVLVDVVTFELEFDRYAVDGFEVGAIVERTIDEHVNLVYTVAEDIDFADYRDCAFRCDHCGTNHNRKKVAVLVDRTTGEHRMVGLACLHDYMGWTIANFATYLTEIEEILNNGDDLAIDRSDLGRYKVYIPVFEYLASCIRLTNAKGYFKDLKYEALKKIAEITDVDKAKAQEVIDFFEKYETSAIFEHQTKCFVTGKTPISAENGYIAYAYTLYQKIFDRIAREHARIAQAGVSKHVGTVGAKVSFMATVNLIGGYETQYGYMKIYKFTDADGNVFVWKTTGSVGEERTDNFGRDYFYKPENGESVKVSGTIKEHNEYRGEKQTVLTRCKVTLIPVNA